MSMLSRLFGSKANETGAGAPAALLTTPVPNPVTSMSELVVQALIPITRENWPHAKNLMSKKIWLPADPDLTRILDGFNPEAPGAYTRCDHPDQPFIVNGNRHRIQLWARRGMTPEARHLVMIQSAVLGTPEKVISYLPQMIVRGSGAPFVMIYRMSCCAETSFSALFSVGDKNGKNLSNVIDSNPTGILSGMGSGVFLDRNTGAYKIQVATSPDDCRILEDMHRHLTTPKQPGPTPPPPAGLAPW